MTSPAPSPRKLVCIESPLRGDVGLNVRYADALMLDSLQRNEAPFLGHLLYPRVLDDSLAEDRSAGIDGHIAWLLRADYVVVGMDLGPPTEGMQKAIDLAEKNRIQCVPRWLGPSWDERLAARRRGTANHAIITGYENDPRTQLQRLAASIETLTLSVRNAVRRGQLRAAWQVRKRAKRQRLSSGF